MNIYKAENARCSYNSITGDVVGVGSTGIIYQGKYKSKTVAIKTLKPGADIPSLRSLLTEVKVQIYLGQHENTVNLIGAVTNRLYQSKLRKFPTI